MRASLRSISSNNITVNVCFDSCLRNGTRVKVRESAPPVYKRTAVSANDETESEPMVGAYGRGRKSLNLGSWIWKTPTTFRFHVCKDGGDLGILRFEVVRHQGRISSICGECTTAARNVREGYRTIPLVSQKSGGGDPRIFHFCEV